MSPAQVATKNFTHNSELHVLDHSAKPSTRWWAAFGPVQLADSEPRKQALLFLSLTLPGNASELSLRYTSCAMRESQDA